MEWNPVVWVSDSRQFATEVRTEFKKITWPAQKEAVGGTIGVVVIIIVIDRHNRSGRNSVAHPYAIIDVSEPSVHPVLPRVKSVRASNVDIEIPFVVIVAE